MGQQKNRQVSLSAFKGIFFCLFLLLITIVGGKEFRNIARVGAEVEKIVRDGLPVFVDNHKQLAKIETLHRISEVIYFSDRGKERRNARGKADELIAAKKTGRYDATVEAAKHIQELADAKDILAEKWRLLSGVETDLLETAIEFSRMQLPHKDFVALVQDNIRNNYTVFFKKNLVPDEEERSCARQLRILRNLADWIATLPAPEQLTAKKHVKRLEDLVRQRLQLITEITAQEEQTNSIWQVVDSQLQELRNEVSLGTEETIINSLREIQATSAASLDASLILYIIVIVLFLAYYAVVYFLIGKPIEWTAKKLSDIEKGEMDRKPLKIYIKEISQVADILDRFSSHIAQLHTHTNRLEEDAVAKQNLEAIMGAVFRVSLDGYIVWDAGAIYEVSEGAMSLLHCHTTEEAMQCWQKKLPLQQRARDVFARMSLATAWREEASLPMADQGALPCELTHMLIHYNGTECFLTYIRDLHEQKKSEQILVAAKEEAEHATQAKGEFLARMSHEIRTPMNGVIGLTQLALDAKPSPEQKVFLEKIAASAQILLGVINDILDFSKMEQGKLALEVQPFSMSEIFITISDLLEPQANAKGIELIEEIDIEFWKDKTLLGDDLRLSQVLLNLCGNAIKFTTKGFVRLTVHCIEKKEQFVKVLFTVADTGIGLSQEQIEQIFHPFAQADSSTTRKYGGTGLGLMISQLLVEQMGGSIQVESKLSVGSVFSFVLSFPMSNESKDAARDLQVHKAEAGVETGVPSVFLGKQVLVVEDNEINQEILRTFLEKLGIVVTTAGNGAEALHILETSLFDCIFMDVQMPVMDGLTATRQIRASVRPEIAGLPIIAMTAHAMREDVCKSLDAGMSAHLTKPVNYAELVSCLESYLA